MDSHCSYNDGSVNVVLLCNYQRKTGGMVVWRSGSKIILYRGVNYKYPYFSRDKVDEDSMSETSYNAHTDDGGNDRFPSSTDEVNSGVIPSTTNERAQPALVPGVGMADRVRFQLPGEAQLSEEADCMLEGLGPRFTDWWGYEPLPVDADLLPAIVPGYRKPFRLLPYGLKPKLTDDEMTTIRRLGRPLPCHFALGEFGLMVLKLLFSGQCLLTKLLVLFVFLFFTGRNRNLQGLAASIVKLWEKCEIAKIAVKRGVQNTNSELMAEELKVGNKFITIIHPGLLSWRCTFILIHCTLLQRLTGGTLLARDREFIVLYRGKDFLPPAVSSAIEERRKRVMQADKQSAEHSTSVMSTQELEPRIGSENKHRTNDHKMGLPSAQRKLKNTEADVNRTSIKLSMVWFC